MLKVNIVKGFLSANKEICCENKAKLSEFLPNAKNIIKYKISNFG